MVALLWFQWHEWCHRAVVIVNVVVQWCDGDTVSWSWLFQWHRWGHRTVAVVDVVVQWWWWKASLTRWWWWW